MGSSNAQEKVKKARGQLREKIGDEIQRDAQEAEALLSQSDDLVDRTAVFKKKNKGKGKKHDEPTEKTSLLPPTKMPGLGDGGGDPKKIIICSVVCIVIVVILGKMAVARL